MLKMLGLGWELMMMSLGVRSRVLMNRLHAGVPVDKLLLDVWLEVAARDGLGGRLLHDVRFGVGVRSNRQRGEGTKGEWEDRSEGNGEGKRSKRLGKG